MKEADKHDSLFRETITSKQNARIKELVKLRDRSHRDATRLFIIEGFREISRALQAKVSTTHIYCCPELFKNDTSHLLLTDAQKQGVELYNLSKEVFSKVSARQGPDGLIAVAQQWNTSLERLKLGSNPLTLIVQGVEKPGNLGSLVRASEGAGIDALIVCDPITDLFNPNTIRNAQGAFFSLPIATGSSDVVLAFIKQHSMQLVATTPDTSTLYWDIDYTSPTAILLGAEHEGLSSFWLNNASSQARIPMHGIGDSLNVSNAGSVILFEAVRQRAHN